MTLVFDGTQEDLDRLPDVPLVGVNEAARIAGCSSKKQFRLLLDAGIFDLDADVARRAPLAVLLAANGARIKPDNLGHSEVYFIETGPFIKIGYSTFALLRLDVLQAAAPYELKLIGSIKGSIRDEERLHAKFSHLHDRREWFNKAPELTAFIDWILARP